MTDGPEGDTNSNADEAVSWFTVIADHAADAFVGIDETQRIVVFNEPAQELFGYRPEEILGQPLTVLVPEGVRHRHGGLVSEFAVDPTTFRSMAARTRLSARRADGTEFDVSISILKAPVGGRTVYGAIVRDVSRAERAEALLDATLRGTAAVAGPEFFATAIGELVNALGVRTAFIAVPVTKGRGGGHRIEHWTDGLVGESIHEEHVGAPCILAIDQPVVSIPVDVQQQFVHADWLRALDAVSCIAVRLDASDGTHLGHLGVIDTKPCHLSAGELSSLRIFAARIAAELERIRSDEDHSRQFEFGRHLLESAPFGFTYRNVETGVEDCNPAFEEMVGRSYAECRRIGWDRVIHPDDFSRFDERSRHLRETGEAVQHTFRVMHPDGRVRWVRRHGLARLNAAGEMVEVLFLVIDLTESHRANSKLAEAIIELERRNDESWASLGAFSDFRFRIDPAGWILDAWAADPSQLPVPPADMVGTRVTDYVSPDAGVKALEAIAHTAATGELASVQHPWRYGDRTGYREARFTRLHDGQVLAVVRDITKLKLMEDQLVHASAMQSIGRLAGGVAHDFNNVLHVIRGHTGALQRRPDDAESVERHLDAIARAVDRTSALIDRLMTISRPNEDDPTPTVVDEFVRGLAPGLRQMLGETVVLELQLAAPDVAVSIDDGRLESAILNLASNARDAMADGGTLTIATTASGSTLTMNVSDTGMGMDEVVAERLFEPFFSTKAVGLGTGLGLATTYDSIVGAGGSISVSSTVDTGTTFTIELPTTDQVPSPERTSAAPAGDGVQGVTILVVEDDPDVLELCVDELIALGYDVVRAATPVEAIDIVEKHGSIDCLLTDVVMPGLSGPELARAITARFPSMPVVYMSGYSPDAVAAEIPPEQLLRKPFTGADLRRILDATIG